MTQENQMGLLYCMAVGDAYGGAFEYVKRDAKTPWKNDLFYHQHPTHLALLPGHYTDGVQMAIALAEMMLDPKVSLSHLDWANYLVDTYLQDPRVGYARGFSTFLKNIGNGANFLANIYPHSDKSGAAERAVVCGLIPDEQAVIDRAMWQASLTHATQDGMAAAACSALLVWGCRNGLNQDELPQLLTQHFPNYPWGTPWTGFVDGKGLSAVRAALTVVQSSDMMADILQNAIELTGDVDGVAGIAMAAAGQHPDITNNLPASLIRGLENDAYGREYLEKLDILLEKNYPRRVPKNQQDEPGQLESVLSMAELLTSITEGEK